MRRCGDAAFLTNSNFDLPAIPPVTLDLTPNPNKDDSFMLEWMERIYLKSQFCIAKDFNPAHVSGEVVLRSCNIKNRMHKHPGNHFTKKPAIHFLPGYIDP